eukprot:snap_masked-scaffold_13-processed-gene-0.20-mRNA-1 protein AED:1.00 eAED:1.00 QI:0/0/0/0/1/1/2/0/231
MYSASSKGSVFSRGSTTKVHSKSMLSLKTRRKKTKSVLGSSRKFSKTSKKTIDRRNSSFTEQITKFNSYLQLWDYKASDLIQIALSVIVLTSLVYDYFFVDFHRGDVFFLADWADLIGSVSYLRSVGIPDEKVSNYASKDYVYNFFSSFAMYRCAGFCTNGLIMTSFSFPTMDELLPFFFIGFLPIYFSPNDVIYEKLEQNNWNQIVISLSWTVSKMNSLKRSMVPYSENA